MKEDEPSGLDSKLCSHPNSLRITFEDPQTSIMLRARRNKPDGRLRVTSSVLPFWALDDDIVGGGWIYAF